MVEHDIPRGARRPWLMALLVALPLGVTSAQAAADYTTYREKVIEEVLPNGLRLLILERRKAPVVAMHTYVDVGAVDEPAGATGVSHMMEHMAFKGTDLIGTRDYTAEQQLIRKIDDLVDAIEHEQARGEAADAQKLQRLRDDLAQAQEEAGKYVVDDEWSRKINAYGGLGLNAMTSRDSTNYFCRMPAQFLEAWLILESERFQFPVFREYYQERDVVMEERRMRTDDSARGSLLEQYLAAAYIAHPYQHPPIGWMSDLRHLTRREGRDFFKQYYHPGNMIIGIVGHVDPDWVIRKVHEYFGDIPAGPPRQRVTTVEPEQNGERRVTWESTEMPLLVIGYHKPDAAHPDAPALQALESILAGGRTSRLHRSLVNDKRVAAFAGASGELPGEKYPNLFSVFAVPMRDGDGGFKTAACEQAIHDEIIKLQRDGVTEAELQRVKTKARAGFIRSLTSNAGLARALTFYEAVHGDWRKLFDAADRIQAVTTEDVLRVARSTLVAKNRTVAIIQPPEPPPWEQEPDDDTAEEEDK